MGLCRTSAEVQQLSRKLEVAWNAGWVERSETRPKKTSGLTTSLRAKRSNPESGIGGEMDCFVALLLAMTRRERTKTSGGVLAFPRCDPPAFIHALYAPAFPGRSAARSGVLLSRGPCRCGEMGPGSAE